jgi:hypothetical protein
MRDPSSVAELAHVAFFGSFCTNLSHLSNILAHFIVAALSADFIQSATSMHNGRITCYIVVYLAVISRPGADGIESSAMLEIGRV